MTVVLPASSQTPASWLAERLSNPSSASEGSPDLNQYLPNDGQTTTNPTRTIHTIHQQGSQRRHG